MKILLLAKYDQAGASSRYRTLQYLSYLQSQGIEVVVNSLLDAKYINYIFSNKKPSFLYYVKAYFKRAYLLTFQKKKYDLCWIEGELFPYLPFGLENFFLPKKYIAEYDDAIFHNYNLHRIKLIRACLGKKISKVMKYSHHVIVGNEYVKAYALTEKVANITILPTVVDANIYKPNKSTTRLPDSKIIIGWLGSPTTVKYLNIIKSALLAVAKKTNVKLCVIGGEYEVEGIETESFHWPSNWSESEEIALLNQIDIGIMPLIESPWEKGKCGFKLIKYMACAKPVIASPVSMNCEIVEHGINGYLAETLADWELYLLKLIENAQERKQFGEAGRMRMIKKYSLQATSPTLHHILANT
ncbi:MAG: glycosyltransferase family 4 protein [Gammaproteobacteria bacterium]|nr:glycosyltransferase family 4 protein [Gammaproteobacteria bacterium]